MPVELLSVCALHPALPLRLSLNSELLNSELLNSELLNSERRQNGSRTILSQSLMRSILTRLILTKNIVCIFNQQDSSQVADLNLSGLPESDPRAVNL